MVPHSGRGNALGHVRCKRELDVALLAVSLSRGKVMVAESFVFEGLALV